MERVLRSKLVLADEVHAGTLAQHRRMSFFAVTLIAALVLGSCGRGGTGADPSRGERNAELTSLRAELEAKIPQASPLEREILADRFVSRAEIDRAAAEVVSCMDVYGIESGVSWNERDKRLQFTIRADDNDRSKVDKLHECQKRAAVVFDALSLQYALDGAQEKRLEGLMIDCLAAKGIKVSQWPADNVDSAVEATCYDASIVQIY